MGPGTGYDAPHPTNVARLAQSVRREAAGPDGTSVVQVPVYVLGVGTGGSASGVGETLDKYLGGAFGAGLTRVLEDTYRQLAFLYQPGDELYVFGFSRGAYMARSLVGLLRSAGIPSRANLGQIPKAIDALPAAHARRGVAQVRRVSALSSELGGEPPLPPRLLARDRDQRAEVEWRLAQGAAAPQLLSVRYLGVFDTVGALGVPGFFASAPILNRDLQFHDTQLTSMVLAARHALALDERRRTFEPTLWDNTPELNRGALELARVEDLAGVPREALKYREEWFAGDHGSVGGGGHGSRPLGADLAWIAEGAAAEGLAFDPAALEAAVEEADIGAPVHNQEPGARDPADGRAVRPTGPAPMRRRGSRGRRGTGCASSATTGPGSLGRVLKDLLGG